MRKYLTGTFSEPRWVIHYLCALAWIAGFAAGFGWAR